MAKYWLSEQQWAWQSRLSLWLAVTKIPLTLLVKNFTMRLLRGPLHQNKETM